MNRSEEIYRHHRLQQQQQQVKLEPEFAQLISGIVPVTFAKSFFLTHLFIF
jgi:hypothetical protein